MYDSEKKKLTHNQITNFNTFTFMETRKKSILIFLGGVASGFILTFIVLGIIGTTMNENGPTNTDTFYGNDLVMLEQPGETIKSDAFKVFQVLQDGSALAMVTDRHYFPGISENYGLVVLFLSEKGKTSHYDGQIINVPTDKKAVQIGTYRYISKDESEKVVPVVKIIEKKAKK